MEREYECDLAKELLTVLAFCEEDFEEQLSPSFVHQLGLLAANSTKEFYLEEGRSLLEQNLSESCKDLLSFLYYENTTPEEKERILQSWFSKD